MIAAAGLWLREGVAYVWLIHSAVQEKLSIETGSPGVSLLQGASTMFNHLYFPEPSFRPQGKDQHEDERCPVATLKKPSSQEPVLH